MVITSNEVENVSQFNEYVNMVSKIPINESQDTVIPIVVDDIEGYIRNGGYVNAWDVINKL